MEHDDLETQNLTRSLHEALILATLADGARHGYQLALEIEARSGGAFRFNHGTLYPILHKLEAEGFIEGDWEASSSRRRRRRYAVTSSGRECLRGLRRGWSHFFETLFEIIGRVQP